MNPATAIAAAVMFSTFIAELIVSRLRKDGAHDLKDTALNVVIGAGYCVSAAVASLLSVAVLTAVYDATPLRWSTASPLYWVVLLLGEDFLYYWSHRASHQLRFMWNSHVVHHNSPRLNLSTGMRNSWVGGFIDWPFMLPLAALGFHPLSLAAVQAFATAVDFVAHTPYFPKNRVLDLFLNSPSNHRVHHAAEAHLRDKNFGGCFIIWDRLFGTYAREEEAMTWGCDPMPSRPHNPVYVELYLWREWLAERFGAARDAVSTRVTRP